MSQTEAERRLYNVNAPGNAVEPAVLDDAFDFEAFFRVHYEGGARAVVRVVRDPARTEEITVEALWELWRNSKAFEDGQAAE